MPQAAEELLVSAVHASNDFSAAVAALACTITAATLLAWTLLLFVLPHKMLTYAIDRLNALDQLLRRC